MPTAMPTDRRQAILDAALALVREGGLEALTINALCVRSGASNGSIYHHFGGRDGVVLALYDDSFARCIASLLPALDRRPAAQVVADLARRYLDWIAANPARGSFIYAAATSPGVLGSASESQERKRRTLAPIASWFAERVARGEVRALPAWSLDPVLMGPAHECARRFLAAPEQFDLAAVRDLVADATWAIARPEPTGGPG